MRNYVKHKTWHLPLRPAAQMRHRPICPTGRLLEIDVPLNGIVARKAFVKVVHGVLYRGTVVSYQASAKRGLSLALVY